MPADTLRPSYTPMHAQVASWATAVPYTRNNARAVTAAPGPTDPQSLTATRSVMQAAAATAVQQRLPRHVRDRPRPPAPWPSCDAATFAVAVNNEPCVAEAWLRSGFPETLQAFVDVVRELRDRPTPLPGAPAADASDWGLFSALHPLAMLREVMGAHADNRPGLRLKLFSTGANTARFRRVQTQLTALTDHHVERCGAVSCILWRKLATHDVEAPMPLYFRDCFLDPDQADRELSDVAKTISSMAFDSCLGKPAITQMGILAVQDALG